MTFEPAVNIKPGKKVVVEFYLKDIGYPILIKDLAEAYNQFLDQ